ncbi:MAG: hypothetical protein AB1341_14635 [Bacillota bacterium]
MGKIKINLRLVLLLAMIILIYKFPLGEFVTKYVVSKHVNSQYSNELALEYKYYDFLNGKYVIEVIDNQHGKTFTMINYWMTNGYLYDDRLSTIINKEYTKNLSAIINNTENIGRVKYFSTQSIFYINLWPFNNKKSNLREDRITLVIENDLSQDNLLTKEDFLEFAIGIINNARKYNSTILLEIYYLNSSFSKENSYILKIHSEQINMPRGTLILLITNPSGDAWK